MKKALKWTGMAILLLVVLPLVVVIAINAFDDTLDARAAAAGEPRAASVPEADNGYIAYLGSMASDGADSIAHGRAQLAEMRAAGRDNREAMPVTVKRAKRPDLCEPAQVSCLAVVRDQAADVAVKLEAYKEDMERYEKVIASRAYEEILDFPLRFMARWRPDLESPQRAYLVRAALAVQDGKIEDALSAVERDIALQRVMLSGARTLDGKSTTAINYRRDLSFLMDLLQTRAAELKPFAPRLKEMLKPIAPDALRMDAALDIDFGVYKQGLKNVGQSHFYKPNATINMGYSHYLQTAEQLRKSPSLLLLEKGKPGARIETSGFRDFINNPVGNSILEGVNPSFAEFVYTTLRLHDLDACNRMVGLGVEIIAADVGVEGVADIVAKSNSRFHDPYTGKPMAWDAGSRRLSFKASDAVPSRKLLNTEQGRVFMQM